MQTYLSSTFTKRTSFWKWICRFPRTWLEVRYRQTSLHYFKAPPHARVRRLWKIFSLLMNRKGLTGEFLRFRVFARSLLVLERKCKQTPWSDWLMLKWPAGIIQKRIFFCWGHEAWQGPKAMEWDSCPRGCEFESQGQILNRWIIFTLMCYKIVLLFEETKNKRKRGRGGTMIKCGSINKLFLQETFLLKRSWPLHFRSGRKFSISTELHFLKRLLLSSLKDP